MKICFTVLFFVRLLLLSLLLLSSCDRIVKMVTAVNDRFSKDYIQRVSKKKCRMQVEILCFN